MAVSKAARPTVQRPAKPVKAAQPAKASRPKPGEVMPSFESMFTPDGDGEIEYPDGLDPQGMVEHELSEALLRIKAEKAARREQYRVITDPNFFLVVCFQSAVQRDEFMEKAGWTDLGFPYVDGLRLARQMGVDVQPIHLPRKQVRAAPKALRDTAHTGRKPGKE